MTRKITRAISRIMCGHQDCLLLGNLNSKRDWGYAPEYCEGMWKMLQQEKPDDFVLATGETHTVREFVELSFRNLGVEIEWKGDGEKETGTVKGFDKGLISDNLADIRDIYSDSILKFIKKGNVVVKIDKNYYRPTEVDILIGDASKAKEKLDWTPKVTFGELVRIMIKADFEKVLKRGF